MRNILSMLIFSLFVFISCSSSNPANKIKIDNATAAIQNWLQIVDSGEYSKSWEESGKIFKNHLTDSQWTDALNKSRTPFGKVVSREKKTAQYKTALPGVPDGEYVIVIFNSTFENKKKAQEIVTVSLENGEWKVVGYYIK